MSKIKILFSALAVVVGIGGAFASKLDTSVTFYQTVDGIYEKLATPSGSCSGTSQNSCQIQYDTDPGVDNFTIEDMPVGGHQSSTKNLWVPQP